MYKLRINQCIYKFTNVSRKENTNKPSIHVIPWILTKNMPSIEILVSALVSTNGFKHWSWLYMKYQAIRIRSIGLQLLFAFTYAFIASRVSLSVDYIYYLHVLFSNHFHQQVMFMKNVIFIYQSVSYMLKTLKWNKLMWIKVEELAPSWEFVLYQPYILKPGEWSGSILISINIQNEDMLSIDFYC